MKIVVFGLSITSSWGNGHATTYRGLLRAMRSRGHDITFFERDVFWYANNRDLPRPSFCTLRLYESFDEVQIRWVEEVRNADMVIVGSYVPDGAEIGAWVISEANGIKAFYDIDTPVTVSNLSADSVGYLTTTLIPKYDLYLSFTGGPLLSRVENEFGSPAARALYCSVDADMYFPVKERLRWQLGYMGTYSQDRQPMVDRLLCSPARRWKEGRFAVIGPQYPSTIRWPANVRRIQHLPPHKHRRFYNQQAFTLNVTRADMIAAGWSPSVRLFEAGACATPIISDWWEGLDTFFEPDTEILIARSAQESLDYLRNTRTSARTAIGNAARARVLAEHTADRRAEQLERYASELAGRSLIAL